MWQSIGMLLQVNLGLFTNVHLFLGHVVMLALMDEVGSLLKFVQRQDVFICDFIATVEVYQCQTI
jgi:hypothetical protein